MNLLIPPFTLFQTAFENTRVGKCLLMPDGKLFAANRALCAYLGYEPEALAHETLASLIHPEERELMGRQQALLAAGLLDSYQFEKRLRHRDGTTLWALVCVTALYQANGDFKGAVAEIQDMSHQRSEDAAFMAEHRRLKLAGKLAQIGSFEIDLATNHTIWSEELRQLIGIRPEVFEAHQEIGLLDVHDEDRDRARQAIQTAIARRQAFRIELRIRHASGEYGHYLSHGRVLTDAQGTPSKLRGYLLNLTPLRQRELALQDANRQLVLQNQALQRLSRLVSDELTDPLAGMQTAAGQEADRGQTREMLPFLADTLRGLELLDEASERLRQTRRLEPEHRRLDIAPVFNRVLQMLETEIQRNQTRITADFRAWSELNFIPGYLENLLFNLLAHVLERCRYSPRAEILVHSDHDPDAGQVLKVLLNSDDALPDGQTLLSLSEPEAFDRLELVRSLLTANGSQLRVAADTNGLNFRIRF